MKLIGMKVLRIALKPITVGGFFLVLMVLAWLIPDKLGLTRDNYTILNARSDIKDFANILYVAFTLWLVLLTQKMAAISFNAQRATSKPELNATLFVTNEKADSKLFGVHNLKILTSANNEYNPNLEGGLCLSVIEE